MDVFGPPSFRNRRAAVVFDCRPDVVAVVVGVHIVHIAATLFCLVMLLRGCSRPVPVWVRFVCIITLGDENWK